MSINWSEALKEAMPKVTEWRHELHRHPEISGQENHTRDFIIARLQEMGIPYRLFDGLNAVMGVLENGEGGCIAVRADMDALPVTENSGLPFTSEEPGVMHACGHDMHMSFALGSALFLSTHKELWHGTVKWLFEPCEETTGGGLPMVQQGCMENPDVACVIGQHVNPNYPVGTFIGKPGPVSGSSDELRIVIRGKGCHGAYPHQGVDAITAAAQVISALQILVARNMDPFDSAVVTIGEIHGGTANNIVADEVRMRGTLRTLNAEAKQLMRERIRQTVEQVAAGCGAEGELTIVPSYTAVTNEPGFYAMISEEAEGICGKEKMVLRKYPSLGVESFCYFEDHTPGVYYDIGSGVSTALHSPNFVAEDETLQTGVAIQCASVIRMLKEISK